MSEFPNYDALIAERDMLKTQLAEAQKMFRKCTEKLAERDVQLDQQHQAERDLAALRTRVRNILEIECYGSSMAPESLNLYRDCAAPTPEVQP